MTNATVYIVDDDASVGAALAFLLKTANYSVQVFGSARQFLESGPVAFPACLLTDVRMADMSGLELQMQVASRFPGLPVVLMTGHGNRDAAVRALEAGAMDVLEKPFGDEKLLTCIQKSIQLSTEICGNPLQRDAQLPQSQG